MAFQVVEEEGPFFGTPPPVLFADAVEIDRERGDEIELSPEIRQRLERLDRPHAALDLKQIQQLPEERKLIDVQPEALMPELLQNEEKEPAAAPEIQDGFRRTTMQLQVLRPDDIQAQPAAHIRVFRVVLFRPGILLLDRGHLRLIDP